MRRGERGGGGEGSLERGKEGWGGLGLRGKRIEVEKRKESECEKREKRLGEKVF